MTNIIKLQFVKSGNPSGREYTYYTPEEVSKGDIVDVMTDRGVARGIITQNDVPEAEIAPFMNRAKTIIGKTKAVCERCENINCIGEGDHICDASIGPMVKMPLSEYQPTEDYAWCNGRYYKEAKDEQTKQA